MSDFYHRITQKYPLEGLENRLSNPLRRVLGLRDLTFLGIAAILGAGIFGTIGQAASGAGPAAIIVFLFTALACLCSALCYAEFSSRIPLSGSAYTYAYVSLGELMAWIIGWDLILEYAIGNISVSFFWSNYFTSFLDGLSLHIPAYLTIDYPSAAEGYALYIKEPQTKYLEAYTAWNSAPQIGSLKIILDLPAFLINILITALVYIGIKESRQWGNLLVLLKVLVVVLIIVVGIFYVQPTNWTPFAPKGWSGLFGSVSAVFFAYIGFDAVSTTAEESLNPQRDMPKAILYSLLICTGLYIALTLVLTGMVPFHELNISDPLAYIFKKYDLGFMSGIVAFSAVIAMTSVLLIFQLGQPRILLSMSRDGLLPSLFSRIHKKYRSPSVATLTTGLVVGIPIFFVKESTVTDLCVIGTFAAFLIVCAGILVPVRNTTFSQGFKVPFLSGRYIYPVLFVGYIGLLFYLNPPVAWWFAIETLSFHAMLLVLAWGCWAFNWSLIPVLGIVTNFYLMLQLGRENWIRFGIWMVVGLIIYFSYGFYRSKLGMRKAVKD